MILKMLISMLRCVWLGLEPNSAGVGQIWGWLVYEVTSQLPHFYINYFPSECMSLITEDPIKCPFTDVSLETITIRKSLLCSFSDNLIKFAVPHTSHKSSLSFRVHLRTLCKQANYGGRSKRDAWRFSCYPTYWEENDGVVLLGLLVINGLCCYTVRVR